GHIYTQQSGHESGDEKKRGERERERERERCCTILCVFQCLYSLFLMSYLVINSIQFYLHSVITMKLSQGALQSPEPEPPYCKHNGNTGKKKLPVSREGTLSRTIANKGGPICLRSAGWR